MKTWMYAIGKEGVLKVADFGLLESALLLYSRISFEGFLDGPARYDGAVINVYLPGRWC